MACEQSQNIEVFLDYCLISRPPLHHTVHMLCYASHCTNNTTASEIVPNWCPTSEMRTTKSRHARHRRVYKLSSTFHPDSASPQNLSSLYNSELRVHWPWRTVRGSHKPHLFVHISGKIQKRLPSSHLLQPFSQSHC